MGVMEKCRKGILRNMKIGKELFNRELTKHNKTFHQQTEGHKIPTM